MSRKELSGEGATSLISSVAFREEQFEDYLPFVSLVDDETILTRGGEYMQCIRVNGLNSAYSGACAHPFRQHPPTYSGVSAICDALP